MSRARLALILANVALAALVAWTLLLRSSAHPWNPNVAYAAVAVATLLAWPLLRRRRLTTLAMASLGAWSTLTGVYLIYFGPFEGVGRWIDWWHGVTSVGFALFFLAHWARNQPRLGMLARRLAERRRALMPVLVAWALVALVGIASWWTSARALFEEEYLPQLGTLALGLAVVAYVYGGIALGSRTLRARLADTQARNRLRGGIDASLLVTMWLAIFSGLPLLWLARNLRAADAFWWLTTWHVIVGAMLLGLVLSHASMNARPLRSHAR